MLNKTFSLKLKDDKPYQVTIKRQDKVASSDILTRINGWLTFIARENDAMESREQVKIRVLWKAKDLKIGGVSWPILGYLDDNAIPDLSLQKKTNNQIMVACEACRIVAFEKYGIPMLPEKINEEELI